MHYIGEVLALLHWCAIMQEHPFIILKMLCLQIFKRGVTAGFIFLCITNCVIHCRRAACQ